MQYGGLDLRIVNRAKGLPGIAFNGGRSDSKIISSPTRSHFSRLDVNGCDDISSSCNYNYFTSFPLRIYGYFPSTETLSPALTRAVPKANTR